MIVAGTHGNKLRNIHWL